MQAFQDVFISYGRRDSLEFASRLNRRLVDRGFTVWFDYDDIPLGVDYQKQIDDGIERADNFLFIISPHSINSPYCRLELELALRHQKRIIPWLHVEKLSYESWQQRNPNGTAEAWADYQAEGLHDHYQNMHPILRKINWIYGREGQDDFEAAFAGLLNICDRHKAYVHQHTLFLAKALEWDRNQKRSPYLLIGEERLQAEEWLKTRFQDSQPPCIPTDLHCEFITESRKNADNLMAEVFLAYAEEDHSTAEQVRNSLRRAGFTVWTNTTDIQVGAEFQQVIDRGIEEADNVVYLLSPAAVRSSWCQHELEYALSLNKRIIPLLVETIAADEMPAKLRDLQYIDLTDNEQETDYQQDESQLLRILRQDATYHETHKLLLTKALKWERQQHNPTMLLRGYNLQQAEAWLKLAKQMPAYSPLPLQETFIEESLRQPPGISLDVFISYSRADSGFARKLNEALQIQGKRTWFDQESIAAGTADFQQEIHRGIESADTFLFILSPRSVKSPYCADEVEYAASLNKRFVTLLHQPIDPSTLHPELAKVQWLDFNQREGDFSANFTELLRILDTDSDHLHAHTRLLLRAIEWDTKGRKESLLLRGDDLEQAEQWLAQSAGKEPQPTELQQSYVSNSRSIEDANQQATQILQAAAAKGKRLVRIGVIVGVIGLLVAGGAGVAAYQYQAEARRDAAQAQREKAQAQQEADNAKTQATEAEQKATAARQAQENAKRELQKAQSQQRTAQQRLNLANAQIREAAQSLQQANRSRADAVAQAIAAQDQKRQAERAARQAEIAKQQADLQVRVADVRLLAATARERFLSRRPFQALLAALEAGKTLRTQFQENSSERQALRPRVMPVLWQAINGTYERNTLEGHQDYVWSLSYSPDGKTIASGSKDKTIKVWDATTGKLLHTLKGHQGSVNTLSYSPDGETITSSGEDKTIKVWDATTGRLLHNLEGADSFSYSLDGKMIASGSDDGTVKLWEVSTGRLLHNLEGHQGSVKSLSYNANGKMIASGSADTTVKVWEVSTGKLLHNLEGHQGPVNTLSYSPDGKTIASGGEDTTVKVWEVSTGKLLHNLEGLPRVHSLSYSPDGKTIASTAFALGPSSIIVWDAATGNLLHTLKGHQYVRSFSYSPDGKTIASASADGTIEVWDVSTGKLLHNLEGHQDGLTSISYSPDGKTIASGSGDKTIKLWEVATSRLFHTLEGADSFSYSPDGKTIASIGQDSTIKVRDAATGSLLQTLEGANSFSYSPDGKTIASIGQDSTIKVRDAATGSLLQTLEGHQDGLTSISYSPDGKTIASGSGDKTINVWDVATGSLLHTLEGTNSFSYSPDGKTIASGSDDKIIKLWDVATGSLLHTLEGHENRVLSLSYSPDGKTIASGSADKTVKVWDVSTGKLLHTLEGHQDRVLSFSYSPDGKTIVASGGIDYNIQVWDVATGSLLHTLEGHQNRVLSLSYSPDGKTIVSGSADGTIKLWVWDFDRLMTRGCNWISEYLITHPEKRSLCEGYLSTR